MKLHPARKTSESTKAYRKRRAKENLQVKRHIEHPALIFQSTRHEMIDKKIVKTGYSTYVVAKHGLIGQDKLRAA